MLIDKLEKIVDKLSSAKEHFENAIYYISVLDVLGYLFILILFLLLIFFAIYSRKNKILMIMIIFFSFISIIMGPLVMKFVISPMIRKLEIRDIDTSKLYFSNVLIVKAVVRNSSKIGLKSCKISALIYKVNKEDDIKNFIYSLQPIKKQSIVLENHLQVGDEEDIKIILEGVDSKKDVRVELEGKCK
jgi:signal transduction histidine kinase